jgi:hypothetical protein
VRPDGHGIWRDRDTTTGFYLEHDTGTEPIRRLVAKLEPYRRLRRDGGAGYPVLFWLPTTARETNLHARLAEVSPPGVPVATAARDAAADPAQPVWRLAGNGPGRLRLADLPNDPGRPGPYNPGPATADQNPPASDGRADHLIRLGGRPTQPTQPTQPAAGERPPTPRVGYPTAQVNDLAAAAIGVPARLGRPATVKAHLTTHPNSSTATSGRGPSRIDTSAPCPPAQRQSAADHTIRVTLPPPSPHSACKRQRRLPIPVHPSQAAKDRPCRHAQRRTPH